MGVEPIDIEKIILDAGIHLEFHPLPEELSGEVEFDIATATIVIRRNELATRQRFTMAAMLGHIVLDEHGYYQRTANPMPAHITDFARALLVPRYLLVERTASLDEIHIPVLAERFKVSLQAMEMAWNDLENTIDSRIALGIPGSTSPGQALAILVDRLRAFLPEGLEDLPLRSIASVDYDLGQVIRRWEEARLFNAIPCTLRFDYLRQFPLPGPEEVAITLKNSKALVSNGGWCRRFHAQDARGKRISRRHPNAVRFSLPGAIHRAANEDLAMTSIVETIVEFATRAGRGGLDDWNERASEEAALRALDEATTIVKPPVDLPLVSFAVPLEALIESLRVSGQLPADLAQEDA